MFQKDFYLLKNKKKVKVNIRYLFKHYKKTLKKLQMYRFEAFF